MAKLIKKAYSFTDENTQKLIEGHNYWVRIEERELGPVDFKVIAKSDLDKKVLDKHSTLETK